MHLGFSGKTLNLPSGSALELKERSAFKDATHLNATGLIVFSRVWRVYARGQVTALHDVSLSIERQDHIAISGPSGSGKSTLLYIASGLDRPTHGHVVFDGREPKTAAQWTRLRARRIGFVFQSSQLIDGFTAAENVEIPMLGVLNSERERRARTAMLLDRVGLGKRSRHLACELSSGESQRVAIARALANSPDVILADEPTGNLDSSTANEILRLLESLHECEKVTLVVVTHDDRISSRANRLIRLLDGGLISDERQRTR